MADKAATKEKDAAKDATKDGATNAAPASQAIVDLITSFWEGISQTLYDLLVDGDLVRLLVLYFAGGLAFNKFMDRLTLLVKKDAGKILLVQEMRRKNLLDLCEKYGEKALNGGRQFYEHLKSLRIPNVQVHINRATRRALKYDEQAKPWDLVWKRVIPWLAAAASAIFLVLAIAKSM